MTAPSKVSGAPRVHITAGSARKPRKFAVSDGAPIEVVGRYDGVPLGKARREVTDEIMRAIQQITGQEEAGIYNDRAPDA